MVKSTKGRTVASYLTRDEAYLVVSVLALCEIGDAQIVSYRKRGTGGPKANRQDLCYVFVESDDAQYLLRAEQVAWAYLQGRASTTKGD